MNLWENYKKICFIAPFEPPGWSAFAIITAWNPASQWVTERRNIRRERALWRHLTVDLHVPVVGPFWGSDPDERWQESSLAVALCLPQARQLAARFGQNALYWVEDRQLWLVPVLMDKSAVCLGNIESFWIARNLA
ncbi:MULTISPECIES: DUF3293 domain-containing protein [Aeromonas]|uniref:DUF3293 domain-containing protein n=1 Tax=Aeromonas TaxID=642 RepID=UPI000CCFB93C|nr:DUF3293 domain-containing protein [Aeromonas veronii]PNW67851.1 DUF3293 domain-containing protein [Aeromonas veronii]